MLNGTRGGPAAGTLFALPGVLALLGLSALYVAFGTTAAVTGLFAGLAPAVVAIVAQAVWRVGRRSLTHPALIALAVASFSALALFAVPFPLVNVAAALIGRLLARLAPHTLRPAAAHSADDGSSPPKHLKLHPLEEPAKLRARGRNRNISAPPAQPSSRSGLYVRSAGARSLDKDRDHPRQL